MWASWARRLELSGTTTVCKWINYDIRPIEAARRTWNFRVYNNFWLLSNFNISTYLTGSALIPMGLSWWQAVIAIVVGNIIAAICCILNSLPGAYYNIGFPVANRPVWGMWGSQFVIWNRIFLSLVWYAFNSWVGGTCVYVLLQACDPDLERRIPNTMPLSASMTTAQFVSYIIFCVISLPVAWIRPHKLDRFFMVASTITITFFIAFLIWALSTMGPDGFGDTISSKRPSGGSSESIPGLMVYGIVSTIGSIAAGILNQNDYTRFATRPRDVILGQGISFPVYGIGCSIVGILITAATQNRFGGEAVWNPPTLLSRLIVDSPTAGTRAAVFFSGLALIVSQIGMNIPGAAFGGGFDLAATFPRFINIRRGAYITMLVSVAVNPWKLVGSASIFLTVLSSYSVFLAPMTGMMIASYLLVSRSKINTDHLFTDGSAGIYWFTAGFNWRAPVSWLVGIGPTLPGLVAAVNPSVVLPSSLVHLYYASYIYGLLSSAFVYTLLHKVFPDAAFDAFTNDDTPARVVMASSREKWDNLEYETGTVLEGQATAKDDDAVNFPCDRV